MPTDSSSSKSPRRRSRLLVWILRLSVFLLLCAAAVAVGFVFLLARLPAIAKWGIEKAFPGAVAEIGSLEFSPPSTLEIRNLALKSRKDGETLLTLDGGSVVFELDDLRLARIGEVRLVNPSLHISPRIVEAMGAPAKGEAQKKPLPDWTLRRLVCDYAELQISGYGNENLAFSAKATFDLKDLSPAKLPEALHEITLWNILARPDPEKDPILRVDLVRLGWTFDGVLQKRTVASIDVKGGDLVVGDELQQLVNSQQAADPQPASPAPPADTAWKIDALKIAGIQVRLDKGTAGIVNGNFELNTELTAITLSQAAGNLASEEQVIELADIEIPSRLDPFSKVLTVRSIFLRFSLAGVLRKELESVAILSPTIYVSEDLFSYMDDAKSATQPAADPANPAAKKEPGWTIKDARIDFGKLVIGAGGQPQYGLPLGFHTRLENVALDNLAALKIDGALRIPERAYTFDSYQLEFTTERKDGKGGELRFSYPPEKNESNLVGTVFLDDIRWRQYRAGDAWLSITFDHEGINGEFGMRAYRGYVSGGFSFFFESETPWVGWIAGKGIDTQRFTDVVSPQNFRMTGPMDFKLQTNALGKRIDRIKGDFSLAQKGKMEIRKLDDMLARIPDTWTNIKKSSTRIALDALRDYPYDKGAGDFWFVDKQGIFKLRLEGPTGKRNFDIVLHADDTGDGRWKQKDEAKAN